MDEGADTAVREMRRGWPTLLGAALGMGTGALSIFYYTQGLFFGPLQQAFGWTRQQLSLVSAAGGFEIAIASVLVGWLVDRFGVRGPALVAYGLVTAAFAALAANTGVLPLFIALQLAVLALGPANGPPSYTRAVNQSFQRARGLALALALTGPGLAALLAPTLLARVIHSHGWRGGYLVLALVTAVSAPVVLILLSFGRRRAPPAPVPALSAAPPLTKALRDPLFLRLLAGFLLMSVGAGGLSVHLIPLLTDAGRDMAAAARVQSLIGLSIIGGRLLMGLIVDRVFAPWAAAAATVLTALGLFALAGFGAGAAPVAAMLAGLSMGAEGDVIGYVTARYFGLGSYGRLYGLLYGAYTIGLGLGPLLMGWGYQRFGGYGVSLGISGGLLLTAATIIGTAPRFPEPPGAPLST
jgi:MFS family permease